MTFDDSTMTVNMHGLDKVTVGNPQYLDEPVGVVYRKIRFHKDNTAFVMTVFGKKGESMRVEFADE
tara:strand:+ start:49 stop:246 length:198 start_codon:yes stop_codon:yes gene_type:complete